MVWQNVTLNCASFSKVCQSCISHEMDAITLYFSYEHNAVNCLDLLYKLLLEIIVEFFREAWSAYYLV